jgi:hypothetical protein
MPLDVLRRLSLFHGIVAWLDALLLLTVAVLSLRSKALQNQWFPRLAFASTVGAVLAFASGLLLEQNYRIHVKQRLFLASKNLGWLFERKQHFSLGVCAFALIGMCALFLVRKDERFFRSLRIAYGLSALLALTSCVISTIVAMMKPHLD